jgi:hypothetical protein
MHEEEVKDLVDQLLKGKLTRENIYIYIYMCVCKKEFVCERERMMDDPPAIALIYQPISHMEALLLLFCHSIHHMIFFPLLLYHDDSRCTNSHRA